jgi:hypothetical protein
LQILVCGWDLWLLGIFFFEVSSSKPPKCYISFGIGYSGKTPISMLNISSSARGVLDWELV